MTTVMQSCTHFCLTALIISQLLYVHEGLSLEESTQAAETQSSETQSSRDDSQQNLPTASPSQPSSFEHSSLEGEEIQNDSGHKLDFKTESW